MNNSLLVMYCN